MNTNNQSDIHGDVEKEDALDRRAAISKGLLTAVGATIGFSLLTKSTNSQVVNNNTSDSTNRSPNINITNDEDINTKKFKKLDNSIEKKISSINLSNPKISIDNQNKITNIYTPLQLSQEFESKLKEVVDFSKNFILNNKVVTIKKEILNSSENLDLNAISSSILIDRNYIKENVKQFCPYTCEFHLNKAASLLERGLESRKEYDDLAIKCLELILELNEFVKLDENLIEQSKNGLYDLDFDKVKSDLAIETEVQSKLISAYEKLNTLIKEKYSDESIGLLQNNTHKMNWASSFYAGYVVDNKEGNPYMHQLNFGGEGNKHIPDIVSEGALAVNYFNLLIQKAANEIQLESIDSNKIASTKRKQYLKNRLSWEGKDKEFKKQRDNILREKMITRLQSFKSPDGILNYLKRIIPIKHRFNNDFTEAYVRIKAVESGLNKIYGYETKAPEIGESPIPVDFFDNCVTWTRGAINFLNRFSQSEVFSKFPISIRRTYKNYNDFLKAYDSGKWVFTLDENDFKDKYNVRLRGISMSIVCLGGNYKEPFNLDGCFKGTIKIPQVLKYKHRNEQTLVLDITNNPKIPEFIIGRVYSTERDISQEVVGGDSIINTSPLGQWEIKLDPIFRNFYYERKGNKIKKKSVFISQTTNEDEEVSDGIRPNFDNIPAEAIQDYLKDLYTKYPKFLQTDFFDIQIDIHIAYKEK